MCTSLSRSASLLLLLVFTCTSAFAVPIERSTPSLETYLMLESRLDELRQIFVEQLHQLQSLRTLFNEQRLTLTQYESALLELSTESEDLRKQIETLEIQLSDLRDQLTDSQRLERISRTQLTMVRSLSLRLNNELSEALSSLEKSSESLASLEQSARWWRRATVVVIVAAIASHFIRR